MAGGIWAAERKQADGLFYWEAEFSEFIHDLRCVRKQIQATNYELGVDSFPVGKGMDLQTVLL